MFKWDFFKDGYCPHTGEAWSDIYDRMADSLTKREEEIEKAEAEVEKAEESVKINPPQSLSQRTLRIDEDSEGE